MALDNELNILTDHTSYVWSFDIVEHPYGDLLLSGSYDRTAKLYDISDPLNPVIIDNETYSNWVYLVEINDNIMIHVLYSQASDENDLYIYDISNPDNKILLSTIELSNCNIRSLLLLDDTLIFGTDSGVGLFIYDISDPSNPIELSSISSNVTVTDISVNNDNLIISDTAKISLYNISNLSDPQFLNEHILNKKTMCSSIKNDILITGDENGVVRVYDISNKTLNQINEFIPVYNPTNIYSINMSENDDLALITGDGMGGYVIYDISDPNNFILVNKLPSLPSSSSQRYNDFYKNLALTSANSGEIGIYDISRFQNDFIDITFTDYPEIRFRGNPLKTDNTITEIEVYVNETLENSYTTDLDQIKTLTINTPDLVDGDNWLTILGYDDQGNESAATVLISDDYFSATNFEYDQENYRFVMPDNKLHAEAAWGKHDVGFITDGIRFFQDRSIIEMIPVISNASSGDTTINLKRIGRVETEVVN